MSQAHAALQRAYEETAAQLREAQRMLSAKEDEVSRPVPALSAILFSLLLVLRGVYSCAELIAAALCDSRC